MNSELAAKLDPNVKSDAERQQAIEQLVFNPQKPDPEVWRAVIPIIEKEPVVWIQQMEIRLLKRLPFQVDFVKAAFSLLDVSQPDLRLQGASLIHQVVDRLAFEKNHEALKTFEEALLGHLVAALSREDLVAQPPVWNELYKTLADLSDSAAVTDAMTALLPKGGDDALRLFAQYVQGKYAESCLEALLRGCTETSSEDTLQHLVRALQVQVSKEGRVTGYANTEAVIQALLGALKSKSENVRREVCAVLAARAVAAAKTKDALPLEDEVWDGLFALYEKRLSSPVARDKDVANQAIAALPINQSRLTRLFDVMHRVQDEMEKQNVVGLIGSFKTSESRTELLRLLRENFAGLRLEAQKITINAVSKYLPDEEIETEFEKLLAGKGLHSDILSALGDKLFSPLPSLRARLLRWLDLNEKTKRPLLEQFQLPMMHTKVIQAARRFNTDSEIQERLLILEPLLMMNDAKVKLNETLKAFPAATQAESKS